MTEIKKSSDVYGGSLGLHTTVNIGVKLLKPKHPQISPRTSPHPVKVQLTADGQFGAAGYKLKEVASLGQ